MNLSKAPPPAEPTITQDGRTWAYLSYLSLFTMLPFFLVPFAQKNDAFAIHHARHAAGAYIVLLVLVTAYFFVTTITCGFGAILFPVVMLPYVPMIHGLILVSNGEWKEPVGVLGLGDRFFSGVKVEQRP